MHGARGVGAFVRRQKHRQRRHLFRQSDPAHGLPRDELLADLLHRPPPLPRLGFELKAALPGPCRVLVGLADDELGYILPDDEFVAPDDYMNPGAQYEESMSPGPTAGSLVLAAAKQLIHGETLSRR